MGLSRWLISKGLWYVAAIVGAYSIAWFFDLVPAPVKDTLKWASDNTIALLFTVCFLAGCFVFLRVKGKKKAETSE